MSCRAVARSLLELRPLCRRVRPPGCFVLAPTTPRRRQFNSTAPIIETETDSDSNAISSAIAAAAAAAAAPPPPSPNAAPRPTQPTTRDDSVRELLPMLASQPGHYITVHIHGQRFLVTRGDTIRLSFKMPGVLPGDVLRLNRASVLGSRDLTLQGSPFVDEALFECRAVVLGTESEPLRIKIKKKRRNRKKKTVKSKHRYTVLRIQDLIVAPPPPPATSAEPQ